MRIVCEEKKTHVATAKVECEELLVHIVKDKRIADEQEKQVTVAAIVALRRRSVACVGECEDGEDWTRGS